MSVLLTVRIIGRYSYLGAMINILLGMIYLEVAYYFFILFFLAVIFAIFGYHIFDWAKCFRRWKHPTKNEEIELPG